MGVKPSVEVDVRKKSRSHGLPHRKMTAQKSHRLKRPWRTYGCLVPIGVAGVLALVISAIFFVSNRPQNRDAAIATAREWARISEIPATATDLNIATAGSAFSREFTISFRDSPANIRVWLSASPGPASANPALDSSDWTIYRYSAGSGAQFAEIRVSPAGDRVVIRTYWS